ncbi:MAG TPA: phosphate ABC transporter substrate-binding protein PstS [Propionibacteriaceae bacterium]
MLGSPDNGVPVMQTRAARQRRIVMPLLIALVVGVIALLLTGRGQQTQLLGSGSTLAQPLIERSITDFRNSVAADNPDQRGDTGRDWVLDGSGIDYEPVGSLGGILRLSDPEVDFAISDYPLSKAALGERDLVQFPLALGAIAVVHNLDLAEGQTLRLDAPTLAGIYRGRITRWNDTALVKLNPDAGLPDLAINAVHRTDGSGSTLGFTAYLAGGSREWADGPGSNSLVEWPAGAGAERSGGLLSAVQGTAGSIGYAEQGQAVRAGLRLAELKNASAAYTLPGSVSMRAATADHDWSGDDDYVGPLTVAKSAEAYPMTVAVYAVTRRAPQAEGDTRRTLRYLSFVLDRYDGTAEDLGYLPLPAAAVDDVKAYWADNLAFSP